MTSWRRARRRSKKRQAGGETVEFVLTLFFFLVIFFMIVDFAIVMFDKGTLINASRVAARQASLFWMDPDSYDLKLGNVNMKMKETMIGTAIDYYADNLVINPDPGQNPIQRNPPNNPPNYFPQITPSGSTPTRVWSGVNGSAATVKLSYQHEYIGLLGLLGLSGPKLSAQTGSNSEAY